MTLTPTLKAKILMYIYNNDKMICLDVVSETLRRLQEPSAILFYMKVKQEIQKNINIEYKNN